MSRNQLRGCLFGGAVFAAGIVPDASAQPFSHIFSRASIAATPVAGDPIDVLEESTNPLGVGSFQESEADFFSYCSVTPTRVKMIHNRASSDAFNYSGVETVAAMNLLEDVTVEISWDHGAWGIARVIIMNYTDPTPVVEFDSAGVLSGSLVLNFEAGETIAMNLATAGAAAGGDSFACIEVPIACPADLDGNGVLNVDDIDVFVSLFLAGCP